VLHYVGSVSGVSHAGENEHNGPGSAGYYVDQAKFEAEDLGEDNALEVPSCHPSSYQIEIEPTPQN